MCQFINIHSHKRNLGNNHLCITNINIDSQDFLKPFSIGIHPWEITEDWQNKFLEVEKKAQMINCCGIGECGIDKLKKTPIELQVYILEKHISLANTLQKPLIIHCVKAYDIILQKLELATVPVIIHDFGKNKYLGNQLQQKGVYLSIGKALLRDNFNVVLRTLDTNLLLLETDNMDISIEEIYKKTAQILGWDLYRLKKQINTNFKRIFK